MSRSYVIAILAVLSCLCIHSDIRAQVPIDISTQHYAVNTQRVLAITTGQYTFAVGQGQLEYDSAMLYTCRTYKLSRLLPYNEEFSNGTPSAGSVLIDSGYIDQAVALLNHRKGDQKTQLLLELGAYYLFKPGNAKTDMANAFTYIKAAYDQSLQTTLEPAALNLLGKYYCSTGNVTEAEASFTKSLQLCTRNQNKAGQALAAEYMGIYRSPGKPDNLAWLQKSLAIYKELQQKEKQIELLADIIAVQLRNNWQDAIPSLEQQRQLMDETGIRHVMYNEDVQAYLADVGGNFWNCYKHATLALQAIQQTGDSSLAVCIYGKIGNAYSHLDKDAEAIAWYKRALQEKNNLPQIFWYKNFLALTEMMVYNNQPQEALHLADSISALYPPVNLFDRIYLEQAKGACYQYLNRAKEADACYTRFTEMARDFPVQYAYGELPGTYYRIAHFYLNQRNYEKARWYVAKAKTLNYGTQALHNKCQLEKLEFRLDSAAGNFRSAVQHYIRYKEYEDSLYDIDQHRRMDELVITHETEKKEQNITLLKQQAVMQLNEIKQARLIRNITFCGIVLLLAMCGLLFHQYRVKKRTGQLAHEKSVALEHLLNEKEWLLKEIHHRVKNNLQTIVSLLESQSAYLQDDALLALQDSQNRVYAMSLIHQKLYQNNNMAAINMVTYLPELTAHLRDSFACGQHVKFSMNIAPAEIDVSQAIPLGLILNEAITNSLKYAFSKNSNEPEISISMQMINTRQMQLVITDNGKGLPQGFDSYRTNSLGMKLMRGLTEDINGQFSISSGNGTSVAVVFEPNELSYEEQPAIEAAAR